jgi:hypothetical protein
MLNDEFVKVPGNEKKVIKFAKKRFLLTLYFVTLAKA